MKSFTRMLIAAGISLSLATPGFAYIFSGTKVSERMSRRLVESEARADNNIGVRLTPAMRIRRQADTQETGLSRLRRAEARMSRHMNRRPKAGMDRYRTLHPNARSLRKSMGQESMLPPSLIQTGGLYDRPTRRDITSALEMLH